MPVRTSTLTEKPQLARRRRKINWELGWRDEEVTTADGEVKMRAVPLTPAEARHPQEGYIIPERTSHTDMAVELRNMLRAWATHHAEMTVFHDLIFEWGHPEIGNYAPDIAVVPNVQDPETDRGIFQVAQEGVRPVFVIEVVSPKTRKTDKINKVRDYALLGIQEYVYIDVRKTRREIVSEIVGYRLRDGAYEQMPVDEDGAVYCETLAVRIGVHNATVWVEDATTGKDLLSYLEIAQAYTVAEDRAAAAENRIAELEAQLRALRQSS